MLVVKGNHCLIKMKKLIIISTRNFDNNLFKNYQIDMYMKEKKLEVECWKLNFIDNYIKDNDNEYLKISKQEQSLKKIKYVNKYSELIKLFKNEKKNFFLYDIEFYRRNILILLIYKFFKCKIIFHKNDDLPDINFSLNDYLYKLSQIKLYKIPFIIFNRLKDYLIKKLTDLITPKIDIYFINGKKDSSMTKKPKKSVFLHTHDYEKYLQEESLKIKKKFIEQDYILFLDMGYPIPYDNIFSKEEPVTTDVEYKNQIVKLLKTFEKFSSEKKIIVALHPKTTNQSFYGFDGFRGITPNLIKYASLIISHDSSSLQLAALWKKPTILLTSDNMQKRLTKLKSINFYSKELNLPIVNIDNFNEQDIKSSIDKTHSLSKNRVEICNNFIVNYIKSNFTSNTNKSIYQTVVEEISRC